MSQVVVPAAGQLVSRVVEGALITAVAADHSAKCTLLLALNAVGRQKYLFAPVVIVPYTAETALAKTADINYCMGIDFKMSWRSL
ncbi:hypothetical protein SAMN04488500_12839 [Sporomusa malonica]|uniref:Uncharacterized protein n=1 Tax=Sporomusa malonica TaxID=112901 RepID=A0A1W2ERA5_9FIRM|nr:hypothetical protein SAMN04488500_12839 [Sporomusa malonica]